MLILVGIEEADGQEDIDWLCKKIVNLRIFDDEFLVMKDGCVRTIQLSDGANTVDRALTMIPELVEKVSALIDRKGGKAAPAETGPEAPNA